MKVNSQEQVVKSTSIVCYVLALCALVIGASFHGYRIHPENVEHYNIGVMMGIIMITLFAVFLVAGIVLSVIYKNKMRKE